MHLKHKMFVVGLVTTNPEQMSEPSTLPRNAGIVQLIPEWLCRAASNLVDKKQLEPSGLLGLTL